MESNIEIARRAKPFPIAAVAAKLGIPPEAVYAYGPFKGKIALPYVTGLDRPEGKLVLVTAISPTPAGEGKTTTTVGLGDALNRIG
ncbi:MAG TPA: formate--tetrahydrofolate ligase, partial [Bauldia sp.]|nr:formate--tetrahydrofolate ligase [Bauldia sp.]